MAEKTTVEKFKKVMVDMYRGYPTYSYFGVFEKEFGKEQAKKIIGQLKKDGIIEVDLDIENDTYYYNLTKKGIDFAIAMTNLNFSQKIYQFTKILVVATIGMFIFSFAQALITLWF